VSDRRYLGIDLIINPYEVAAEHLANLVTHPWVTDYNQFLEDRALLVRFAIAEGSPLAGVRVLDFGRDARFPETLIALVQRGGESLIPEASMRVQPGDQVYFFCQIERLGALARFLGHSVAPTKRVFINGGGHIGFALARRLERMVPHVRLMEINEQRCMQMAQLLDRALVLHVDGTSSIALKQEGIEQADVFLSCTNQDQVNVVACLLAGEYGAAHTIALVKQPEYIPIIEGRGVADVAFSPRLLTARKLLRFVRGEALQSFFAFPNSDVELLEMDITPGARCDTVPLSSLDTPAGVLVGAVKRGERIFIPRGQDALQAGDRVLLIQQRRHRKLTGELFAGDVTPVLMAGAGDGPAMEPPAPKADPRH
jgi:trk system potassium uptake protein TrkA